MPIPKSTLRPIAPKPQTPVQDPDVIAVLTFTPSEIQEVTVPTTDVSTPVITKVSKKNNGQKTERASSVEEETGWDDTNTGLLISFLEDNFDIYKKNKSNFAKTAATKIFSGKLKGEQNRKWFDRLDALFETHENHNPGFLVDGFSDDVQLFDSFKEKETETNEEVLAEKKDNQITKKRKSLSQDPLAEAIISMSNARQIIWEKRLASENDQFEKKQVVEKEE
ncbi:hypothetical protein RirG_136900 [Rhizophagus irregularis DAOM 197198w]|uniref:Uncharacterized protein n=2 Tax=Rhizophagus irregularis TaxID=588596 RepID=A0A015KYE8_RHIIW|nr:hypothetical protein RirG_136900 [Rhizophagus irregularis DAOM 197198w]